MSERSKELRLKILKRIAFLLDMPVDDVPAFIEKKKIIWRTANPRSLDLDEGEVEEHIIHEIVYMYQDEQLGLMWDEFINENYSLGEYYPKKAS